MESKLIERSPAIAKRRLLVALVALVLDVLGMSGAALASESQREPGARDHRVFCERLEAKAQHLRAALARLDALATQIERKIASGELTEEQLARARHALAAIEAKKAQLQERLERLMAVYQEKCVR